jgi:hypothetical protein
MPKQVKITTPMPTIEETARIAGVSSSTVKELISLAHARGLLLNSGEKRRAKVDLERKRNPKKPRRAIE